MNEPWAGSVLNGSVHNVEAFDAGPYRAFLERCIAAIRAVDADSWIFYEPRAWGPNDGFESKIGKLEDPRVGEPRLVYFPHYYSTFVDAFGNWTPDADESIERWARNRKAEIDLQQAPLLIGEWGTGTETTEWRDYLETVVRMADRMTSGWAYWEYGRGGWSPIDADGNESPQADVLVRAYPQRVAGTPRFVDYDPDTRVLRVGFDAKPGVDRSDRDLHPGGAPLPERLPRLDQRSRRHLDDELGRRPRDPVVHGRPGERAPRAGDHARRVSTRHARFDHGTRTATFCANRFGLPEGRNATGARVEGHVRGQWLGSAKASASPLRGCVGIMHHRGAGAR